MFNAVCFVSSASQKCLAFADAINDRHVLLESASQKCLAFADALNARHVL